MLNKEKDPYDCNIVQCLGHNLAYGYLVKVIEFVDKIKVLGVSMDGEKGELEMTSQESAPIFQMTVLVTDVLLLGAFLHKELLMCEGKENIRETARLFNITSNVLRLFFKACGDLDAFVNGSVAIDFEKRGLTLPCPVAIVRQRALSMAAMGKRAQDLLLKEFARVLQRSSDKCGSICGFWEAFVGDEGHLKLSLCEKELLPKAGALVNAHNALFSNMASASKAATALELVPRLQFHDLTVIAVANCLATLRRSSQTDVLINGVRLLLDYANLPEGAEKARDFNKIRKIEKNSDIPKSLWAELELMAGGAASVNVKAASNSDRPPAKRAKVSSAAKPEKESLKTGDTSDCSTAAPRKRAAESESSESTLVLGSAPAPSPAKMKLKLRRTSKVEREWQFET